jgi:hypothetical protein
VILPPLVFPAPAYFGGKERKVLWHQLCLIEWSKFSAKQVEVRRTKYSHCNVFERDGRDGRDGRDERDERDRDTLLSDLDVGLVNCVGVAQLWVGLRALPPPPQLVPQCVNIDSFSPSVFSLQVPTATAGLKPSSLGWWGEWFTALLTVKSNSYLIKTAD